jgi:S1-C subfamily serine protease
MSYPVQPGSSGAVGYAPYPHSEYPPQPPQPPRRRWMVPIAGVIAAAALATAGGVTAVAIANHQGNEQVVASHIGSTDDQQSNGQFPGFFGQGGPNSNGNTSGNGNNTAVTVPSSITDAVDPTIVDINVTLGLQQAAAAGTGIVLTSDGEILTNNHVIDGATAISVTDVGNGQTYKATVVGYDRTDDLAVLQLTNASGLATASIGSSASAATGDTIYAIGNAGGTGGTPAAAGGTIAALNQSITATDENGGNAEQLTGLIQVAADIQAGDSGGPLVDTDGHVIGINTAGNGNGAGFAIPIDAATSVAAQIEAGKASTTIHLGATAFLGISATESANGVQIAQIVQGSAAETAGLTAGDTLTALDGTTLDTAATLTSLLGTHHPGDRVKLTYLGTDGAQHSVTVTLAEGPAA